MAFQPLAADAPAIVYIDIKSPYAFLAHQPLRQLEADLGCAFAWRPLTLDIASYLGSARLDSKGAVASAERSPAQWLKVKYAYRDARRYAALQGHTLRGTEKIWNTRPVHLAMMWLQQHQPAADNSLLHRWLAHIWPAFWQRAFTADCPDTLAASLAHCGVPSAGFAAWADAAGGRAHDAQQAAVFDAGLFGVPTVVVRDQVFFGREHLGRIRRLLTGRPDHGAIAYDLLPAAALPWPGKTLDTSALAPFSNKARVLLGIDPHCPRSRLGLPATLAWLAQHGLALDHPDPARRWALLPMTAAPIRAPRPLPPAADRGTRHRWHRSHWLLADLRQRARAIGLPDIDPAVLAATPAASAAQATLLALAAACPDDVADWLPALVAQCWAEPGSGCSTDAMLAWLQQTRPGQPWAALLARAPAAEASAAMAQLAVLRGPALLLDGELFQGEEHLPLLSQRLAQPAANCGG